MIPERTINDNEYYYKDKDHVYAKYPLPEITIEEPEYLASWRNINKIVKNIKAKKKWSPLEDFKRNDPFFGSRRRELVGKYYNNDNPFKQANDFVGNAAIDLFFLPSAIKATPYVSKFFVKNMALPMATGMAIDEVSKLLTGTTSTEVISNYLLDKGWNPWLSNFIGGFSNPGYWLNPAGKYTSNLINKPFKLNTKPYGSLTLPAGNYVYPKSDQYTPQQWDDAYFKAIQSGNMDEVQRLRDLHYMANVPNNQFTTSSGSPITYYHGTRYGGHSIFDNSVSNASLGSNSVIGEKGNFLTTSLPAAEVYADGGTTINPKFLHTYTNLPVSKLMSINHPIKTLLRKQYNDYDRQLINQGIKPKKRKELLNEFLKLNNITSKDVYNPSVLLNNVVYPLYVNPGNDVRIVDFEGRNWQQSPLVTPTYKVVERNPMWIEHLNGRNDIYDETRTTGIFDSKDDAILFMNNNSGNRTTPTTISDGLGNVTNDAFTNPGIRRRYITNIGVFENKYPLNTNGVVLKANDTGATSVVINNVKDGVDYPINDMVVFNSNLMKLASPITYDNKGNIIPLSRRDNWHLSDIRYLFPILGIGTLND